MIAIKKPRHYRKYDKDVVEYTCYHLTSLFAHTNSLTKYANVFQTKNIFNTLVLITDTGPSEPTNTTILVRSARDSEAIFRFFIFASSQLPKLSIENIQILLSLINVCNLSKF